MRLNMIMKWLITWEVCLTDEVLPHLSGSQRMELLNAKLEIWMGGVIVSLFIFLKCHPITWDESHTGPSSITLFLFASNNAVGHVPKTLLNCHINHN